MRNHILRNIAKKAGFAKTLKTANSKRHRERIRRHRGKTEPKKPKKRGGEASSHQMQNRAQKTKKKEVKQVLTRCAPWSGRTSPGRGRSAAGRGGEDTPGKVAAGEDRSGTQQNFAPKPNDAAKQASDVHRNVL